MLPLLHQRLKLSLDAGKVIVVKLAQPLQQFVRHLR